MEEAVGGIGVKTEIVFYTRMIARVRRAIGGGGDGERNRLHKESSTVGDGLEAALLGSESKGNGDVTGIYVIMIRLEHCRGRGTIPIVP